MIDKNIKIIIDDMTFHTREILNFLKFMRENRDDYLDDLIDFALCTEEDIQTIESYIFELEMKLYNTQNGGDVNE